MYSEMPVDERNRMIRMLAHGFAAERYKLANPGCGEDEAWAHAGRNWREMVPVVIDFMATCDAADEAEAAARGN